MKTHRNWYRPLRTHDTVTGRPHDGAFAAWLRDHLQLTQMTPRDLIVGLHAEGVDEAGKHVHAWLFGDEFPTRQQAQVLAELLDIDFGRMRALMLHDPRCPRFRFVKWRKVA
jgi:hypothetical protein